MLVEKVIVSTPKIEEYEFHISKLAPFDILLENVNEIEFKHIDIYNSDYIITEYNNTFVYRENKGTPDKKLYSENREIIIDPGNYTQQEFINELEFSLGNDFVCSVNSKNNKFTIICNTGNFDILNGSILHVLGFENSYYIDNSTYTSENPIRLFKNRYISVNILINESDTIFKEKIILDNDFKTILLNKKYFFETPVYIENITIDFENTYNPRGYPMDIMLVIKSVN